MINFLKRTDFPDLAYCLVNQELATSKTPIVFLGGFRSDMQGTKAVFLENYCRENNHSFLRFDYSGHGQSHGNFDDLTISDWARDAVDIIKSCFDRPVLLVGSSMGGWIGLILAKKFPDLLSGFVGLAAAPDFTQWIEEKMNSEQKKQMNQDGFFALDNDYGDPYMITKQLIEDGRDNFILNKTLDIDFPVHLIQGKKDADVPWKTAEDIKQILPLSTVSITYIENGDHRLSSPDELMILQNAIDKIICV